MKKKIVAIFIVAAALGLSACAGPKSSYELAVEKGFQGTEAEWLESLRGATGAPGQDGVDGAVWYSGEGSPENTVGKSGDYYLDFSDGKVYRKSDSGWEAAGALYNEGYDGKVVVTFDANFGTLPQGEEEMRIIIDKGASIDLPIPTRDGYEFLGWCSGDGVNAGQATDLTAFTRDIKLTAKWCKRYSIELTVQETDIVVGDFVTIIGSYNGTAKAEFTFFLEKGGERKEVFEATDWGWGRHSEQERDGKIVLEISFTMIEAGEYKLIVLAEEGGEVIESSVSFTVRETF